MMKMMNIGMSILKQKNIMKYMFHNLEYWIKLNNLLLLVILIIGIEYLKEINNTIMIIEQKDKNIIMNIGL